MTDKNIQMSQRNATNDGWDNLYPKTKAANVLMADSTIVEDYLTELKGEIDQDVRTTASPIFLKTTFSQATGTPPMTVASTTKVANLNVDQVDGHDLDQDVKTTASPSFSNLTLTQLTGTAPLTVTSTTKVTNLNADKVNGYSLNQDVQSTASPTFAKLTLSQAAGTAPMTVTSTTKVTNLNADMVDGYTAGNASGNIPVSNGAVNTNLNADMIDGLHSTALVRGNVGLVGTTYDFNTALSNGQYKVNGTNIVGAPVTTALVGKLMVMVDDGGTHDNSTNSIVQYLETTAGLAYRRWKSGSGAWQTWVKLMVDKGDGIIPIGSNGACMSLSGGVDLRVGATASNYISFNAGGGFDFVYGGVVKATITGDGRYIDQVTAHTFS